MATTNLTNVIGYFNPNDYPLQLVLSEFNVTLQLPPKSYVVDRGGRLVNDPYLDAYVGKGRLSRASDPKQQVEITLLRPVNDPTPAPTPAPHQHSVSQASRFDTKNGVVVPVQAVSTAPMPPTPPPQSYNPVRGMTVEQAKAMRLIKPTRPVPEDFGADESTGAPKAGQEIPTIRYATDTVRGRKPAPLPAELAQPATPQQAAIVASLERAAATNPDDPNLLSGVARAAVAETLTPTAMPTLPPPQLTEAAPPPPPPVAPIPARVTAPPIPVNPTPSQFTQLPPPVLEEAPQGGLVVEDELPGVGEVPPVSATEEITEADRVEAAQRVPPPPSDESFVCGACKSTPFASKGLLLRHVRRFHKELETELMAPYA